MQELRPDSQTQTQVWTWLPGAVTPVAAGTLHATADGAAFAYSSSYLETLDAVPLYHPAIAFASGRLPLLDGASFPRFIRDAAPDAWGRKVLVASSPTSSTDFAEIGEIEVLLGSGSDRTGAMDFQASPSIYVARDPMAASLEAIAAAIGEVDSGRSLLDEAAASLRYRSGVGGARPKALIEDGDRKYVAKFSSSGDVINVVKAEFIAMRLAAECGLDVAPVKLVRAGGKDVLLVERFDRVRSGKEWSRKAMVSVLTILGLDELMARYASYEDLAEIVPHRFAAPQATLRELFGRIVFNILSGNTDDHARNHAAFWDGARLVLTPAYDICPQMRSGQEASQAMLISGSDRMSRIGGCLSAASKFGLSGTEAVAIVIHQLQTIAANWLLVCSEAGLEGRDRDRLWAGCFLNPYAFTGLADELGSITSLADRIWQDRG